MVLSEAEAEAQLAALRRQREALDRAIGDLTLYLELGRRLTAAAGGSAAPGPASPGPDTAPPASPMAPAATWHEAPPHGAVPFAPAEPPRPAVPVPPAAPARPAAAPAPILPAGRPETATAGTGAAGHGPPEGVLSDGVLARRYGRALIEAALAALEEAGRPLHAGEILAVLNGRGFSLPGHDPVAALNTRLWKRSGPGGPLRRMGDAVYALAEPEEEGGAGGDGSSDDED